MVKRLIFAAMMVMGMAALASAQTATPSTKLVWDAPTTTVSATDAQSHTYRYYPDGGTTGTVLASVVCVNATAPYVCSTNFPAFTPGSHTLTVTAANVAGEGPKSTPLAFTFVVVPSAPTNLRIQ